MLCTLMISTLVRDAQEQQPDVVRLRRAIHRHPELGLHLPRTQAAVVQALEGLGLSIRMGERLTSVVATLEGARPGPSILLRADMDALPVQEETGLEFASQVDADDGMSFRSHAGCGDGTDIPQAEDANTLAHELDADLPPLAVAAKERSTQPYVP